VLPARAAADVQPLVAVDVDRVLATEPGNARIVGIRSLDCGCCRENVARIAMAEETSRRAWFARRVAAIGNSRYSEPSRKTKSPVATTGLFA
jgi:hypothetical protein